MRSIYNLAAALDVPGDTFFPDQNDIPVSPVGITPVSPQVLSASEMREAEAETPAGESVGSGSRRSVVQPVLHPHGRPMIELKGGVTWERLTAFPETEAEFLEITYAPGGQSGSGMSRHNGREFGLVLEGELQIELGFERYMLQRGDSIVFASTTPHRLSNNGPVPMRAVWVVLNSP